MRRIATLLLGTLFALDANALPINALPLPNAMDSLNTWILPDTFTEDYDFEGIVALNNCSGSLVKFEGASDDDAAMVLTNGHCMEGGFVKPGQHNIGKKSSRTFGVLNRAGKTIGRVKAVEILYGTMTSTDMALYRLEKSIGEVVGEFSVSPLVLSKAPAASPTSIEVISGYWKRGYRCAVNGIVHQLKEAGWTWENSIRYSEPGCETIGGTSGSPVLAAGTRTVIGVNNTGNESGEQCTMNNPCEVDEQGKITYRKGLSYGQQIAAVYDCLTADNQLDLTLGTCKLPH